MRDLTVPFNGETKAKEEKERKKVEAQRKKLKYNRQNPLPPSCYVLAMSSHQS